MADQVFICYARQDEDFVLELAGALKAQGVPVWIDQWDIPGSADWDMEIEKALSKSSHMVVVLSPASMKSEEVRSEWRAALQAGKPIIPVLIQMCTIHRRLQLIQHIDFTSTSPTDEAALSQVVGALGMQKHVQAQAAEGASKREAEERPPPVLSEEPSTGPGSEHPGQLEPEPALIHGRMRSPDTSPIHLDLVRIPAGAFSMGSAAARDQLARSDEFPQHQVYVPEFHIGRYPVTNLQYQAFIQATGYRAPSHWKSGVIPPERGNRPVVFVSWADALAFCTWLNAATGQPYRLPTEAEWEKAARGADGRIWPWGNEPPDASRCNLDHQVDDTTPVGWYSPQGDSPYGCADMVGNVWEWCHSLYQPYPYRAGDGREDLQANGRRVLRGGSFIDDQNYVRCASRIVFNPDYWGIHYGFRVVRGPLPGAP